MNYTEDEIREWIQKPCVAAPSYWDVWIHGSHGIPEKRGVKSFIWAPPERINEQYPEQSLKKYRDFITGSPYKMKQLPDLFMKSFGCWCYYKGARCHGPTLAQLVYDAYKCKINQTPMHRSNDHLNLLNQFLPKGEESFELCQKFVSCFVNHHSSLKQKTSITCYQISPFITSPILESPICTYTNKNANPDSDEEMDQMIQLTPHKIVPLATWTLNKTTPSIIKLYHKLIDRYNSDAKLIGLGLNSFTVYKCAKGIDEKHPNGPLFADMSDSMFQEAEINIDSQIASVLCALLFVERNDESKVLSQKVLLFSQSYYDLQFYDPENVDFFATNLFESNCLLSHS